MQVEQPDEEVYKVYKRSIRVPSTETSVPVEFGVCYAPGT